MSLRDRWLTLWSLPTRTPTLCGPLPPEPDRCNVRPLEWAPSDPEFAAVGEHPGSPALRALEEAAALACREQVEAIEAITACRILMRSLPADSEWQGPLARMESDLIEGLERALHPERER